MKTLAILAFGFLAIAGSAEAVQYTLTFERAQKELVLEPADPEGSGAPFTAFVNDVPGYQPLFETSFSHDGALAGLTLDMEMTETHGFIDHWETPTGFITFGDDLDVVAWDVADDADGTGGAAFAWHHRSGGAFEDRDSWLADTLNPELMDDIFAHYGVQYTEPSFFHFTLAPGQWSCLADGMACGAEPTYVPIPAALPMLLVSLGILAVSSRRRGRRE